jgi:hypothetical protein
MEANPAMALYLVSYDVPVKNESEYQELWDYLEGLGGIKILYSEYAVPFTGKAIDLATEISSTHLKKGDRLLVCELFDGNGGTISWLNLKISDDDFRALLKKHARTIN